MWAAQIRTRPPFPSVRRYEPSVRRVSDVGSFRTQSPDFFIVVPSARETCGGALAHKSTPAAAEFSEKCKPLPYFSMDGSQNALDAGNK
jgi:hypothetical protein